MYLTKGNFESKTMMIVIHYFQSFILLSLLFVCFDCAFACVYM